jgi:CHAT domain-containing protein
MSFSQTKKEIWYKNEDYKKKAEYTSYPSIHCKVLGEQDLLDIHLFNLSYASGIKEFIDFKGKFHYAVGKSDIPNGTYPLDYLFWVLSIYEHEQKYRVAFIYYDAITTIEKKTSGTADYGNWLIKKDSLKKKGLASESESDLVRIWYVSRWHLHKEQTDYTFNQVKELEAATRIRLGVDIIGSSRSPRSNIKTAKTLDTATLGSKNAPEELSKLLLPDTIVELMEKDQIDAVIVIPYGIIGQVPFHALPLNSSEHFVDRYAYTIAPHLSNYIKVFQANPNKVSKRNFLETVNPLIVGNPKFYSSQSIILPDLPGAAREASIIASLVNTTALIGEDAQYDAILNKMKNSDFAYFATHAVPSFEDPANKSFLALTPSKNSKNGYLNISTIQKVLEKKTKLVVLSACQTGVGKSYKNGYCNIGRGFFIAGVDNAIMSLWNLDDENIVPFMTILMEELKKPQYFYPAENLRQAILRYKKISANPAYWSAMVNFGITY